MFDQIPQDESKVVGRVQIDLPQRNQKSSIVVSRVDLSPLLFQETVSLNDALPLEFQEVLDTIHPEAPIEWREQATKAAYFIWSLDEGKQLTDKNGQSLQQQRELFVDQLGSTTFVGSAYVHQKGKSPNPQKTLPYWLHTIKSIQHLTTEQEKTQVADWYQRYASIHATIQREKDGAGGYQEYADYHEGVPQQQGDRKYLWNLPSKSYIDGAELRNFDAIENVLVQLRQTNLHPHTSKLFEDSLVLYWRTPLSVEQKQSIRVHFNAHNIHMRGFAQDSYYVLVTPEKNVMRIQGTNDSVLGAGGFIDNPFALWEEKQYKPDIFLKQYLQLTYWGYKNPAEPYSTSFVPIVIGNVPDSEERRVRIVELQERIARVYKLPTIVMNS